MTAVGYALSPEARGAVDLVRHARRAEEAGFSLAMISEHHHPWIEQQSQSPHVWGVLGAIAQATETIRVGTGVRCTTVRIDPVSIAQASATAASLMPGRFFLGLDSGQRPGGEIADTRWPPSAVQAEALGEAVGLIRELWDGSVPNHRGRRRTANNARIHALPDRLPPIYLMAGGREAARQAARLGDGLIGTSADGSMLEAFGAAGGQGPRLGRVTVCWAASEAEARSTAREWWPTVAVHGDGAHALPNPARAEPSTMSATEDQIAGVVPCGPDPERHLARIAEYVDAGYDQVYLHQIGPDQTGFIKFAEGELLPALKADTLRIAN